MNRNRVYSYIDGHNVLATTNVTQTFNLLNFSTPIKVKSIMWDLRITDPLGIILALETQTTQDFMLFLEHINMVTPITNPFQNFILPLAVAQNGTRVQMTRPQQIFFDSFYIPGNTAISINMTNHDALINYTYNNCVIIETEIVENMQSPNCKKYNEY